MTADSNGGCATVGPPVYVCPSGMVMHDNGTCSCPRGETMVKGKCQGPEIKGIQKFRPRPNTQVEVPQVGPAAAGLPNTGADGGLGVYAMAGAGLLVAGGALLLFRRRTARH
jgi:LPXTG-motif cell wall-anchored protein